MKKPHIKLVARGVYECADQDIARTGRSIPEAFIDWAIAKVAAYRATMLQPHLRNGRS